MLQHKWHRFIVRIKKGLQQLYQKAPSDINYLMQAFRTHDPAFSLGETAILGTKLTDCHF